MQFSKIVVVVVAALVCTSSAARGHMFENGEPFLDVSRRCGDEVRLSTAV